MQRTRSITTVEDDGCKMRCPPAAQRPQQQREGVGVCEGEVDKVALPSGAAWVC